MLYRISVTERGLTGIANIFRSRLSRLDDLLGAGTVPLTMMGIALHGKNEALHGTKVGGAPPCAPTLMLQPWVEEKNM